MGRRSDTQITSRILVLAADISPMDIISHLPCLSEEHKVPYVFVASKAELGVASCTKRPTSCVMICPNMKRGKAKPRAVEKMEEEEDGEGDDYRELYEEIREELFGIVSVASNWSLWGLMNGWAGRTLTSLEHNRPSPHNTPTTFTADCEAVQGKRADHAAGWVATEKARH